MTVDPSLGVSIAQYPFFICLFCKFDLTAVYTPVIMIDEETTIPASVTLDPAPQDTVSRVAFGPDGTELLMATWTGALTVHKTDTGALHSEAKRHVSPLLDATWHPQTNPSLLAAALDGSVLHATIAESAVGTWRTLGRHDAAARVLVPSVGTSASAVLSAGWDGLINLWDVRAKADSASIASISAGSKVFGAAKCGPECAIFITSERRVRILDIRNTSSFLHDRVPPKMAYQLRGISASPDGSQYAVGSTEGRVAVEWLQNDNKTSFSFRCHRVDGLVYPVNCISHNRSYGSFATGGGDGHVAFWDGDARKRIAQFSRYPTSIASIDFDNESSRIAIAVSYTFEEGEKDHPPDEVHIRALDHSHIATRKSKEQGDDDHQKEPQQQPPLSPQHENDTNVELNISL